MKRLLAALFLACLILECVPLALPGVGCDMPCCKRAGKADCCPRRMMSSRVEGDSSAGCRMVACGARTFASNTIGSRQPALLEAGLQLNDPLRALPAPEPGNPSLRRLAAHPPTPPPRNLQI